MNKEFEYKVVVNCDYKKAVFVFAFPKDAMEFAEQALLHLRTDEDDDKDNVYISISMKDINGEEKEESEEN